MTRTTYTAPANTAGSTSDPNVFNRCEVRSSLHLNNADRSQLDASKPVYLFDSATKPTKLGMQFRPSDLPDNNILYGKTSNKQIVFNDYLVVRIQVVYTGQAGTADDEVVLQDEGFIYLQVTNPCIVENGGAVTPKAISDIEYWIKDTGAAQTTHQVTLFNDNPTTAYYTA